MRRIASVASRPAPTTTAAAVKVSAIACAVSRRLGLHDAPPGTRGRSIGGRSIVERSASNRASPHAVSADSPTDNPSKRTTITTDAAAPR